MANKRNETYEIYRENINGQIERLLKPLQECDFETAAAMAPNGYRLCGYQEFSEPYMHSERGIGWAGQYSDTEVPPGKYPVFALEYRFDDSKAAFANELKDYPGIMLWYAGSLVRSSNEADETPCPHLAYSIPYCHSLAKEILDGNSSICLLPPFEAKPVQFEYEGEVQTTFKIVDTSLSSYNKENPMRIGKYPPAPSLDEQILSSRQTNSDASYTKETKAKPDVDPFIK